MRNSKAFQSVALAAALLTSLGSPAQQTKPTDSSASNSKGLAAARAAYGQVPLTFEANRGQTDPRVKFLSRGNGYSVFLTGKGMVLALKPTSSTPPASTTASTATGSTASNSSNAAVATTGQSSTASKSATTKHVVQFTLLNAAANPVAVGENPQPGQANYFVGNKRSKWHTGIPMYGQVRYQNVYPGIDLVYYGNHRQVEYDFDLAVGADPSQIKFQVTGADSLSISDSGDLVMTVGTGQLEFKAPAIYQEVNGKKTQVAGQYQVNGNEIDFAVADHDSSKPLVIDPVLVYSTYLGGRGNDYGIAIGVDSTGNAYITGNTSSPDFPLSSSGTVTNSTNSDPLFVAKLDVSGATILYADYIEGSSEEDPQALAVAADGTVYVGGETYSSDFPTVAPFQAALNSGGESLFISKLSPDGSTLEYSTYLGGSSSQNLSGLALGPNGEIMVGGSTNSSDFPTANAIRSTFPATGRDDDTPEAAFATELTADGSSLIYSTYLSGTTFTGDGSCYYCSLYTEVTDIRADAAGNMYIAGRTDATDFPTTSGVYQATFPGTTSGVDEQTTAFVTKLTSTGQLGYSTYLAAIGATYVETYPYDLAVDSNGEVYVDGYLDSGTLPSIGGGVCTSSCGQYFLVRLSATADALNLSTMLPQNINQVQQMKLDSNGNVFLLGSQQGGTPNPSTNAPPLENAIESPDSTASEDGYLLELDPGATQVLFGSMLGGAEWDDAEGMAIDKNGAVYITGQTQSSDFPVTETSYQQTLGGSADSFIAKIDMNTVAPAVAISPSLVQFSVLNVGVAAPQKTVLLRNMGSAPLNISSIQTSGDFSETDNCSPSVPAGGSCNLTVTFTPTQPGSRFGTILLQDDAVGSPHFINLSGVGSTPLVELSGTSLSFSSLSVGTTSTAQTVTLTNNGNATLNIATIAATGDFAETNNCPASLALSASCQIQVTFTPTTGGSRTGSLTITDNAPDSPETVSLTGSGYVTTATISPSALQFGNEAVNATATAQVVTVTNTGSNPMVVSSVSTTGNFAETNNCGTVAPSASCTVNVTFTPKSSGSLSGTLVLNDNANGNPHQVSLSGTGVAPVVNISPSALTFATQAAGSTSTQTLTVTNSGNAALSFSSIQATGDFSQTNNCSSVPAAGTCTVTVTFAPTTSGPRAGSITFVDAAADSPQTVALSGTGAAGALSVSPSNLTFSAQPLGVASAAQTVTLSNTGTAALSINGISAVGSFQQTNNCPASLAIGGSCQVSVTFTPQAAGSASGALTVAGLSSTVPVTLSGTGSDFSITASPASASVASGTTATYTLNVAPNGGAFSNAVNLSCAGGPAGSTCSLSKSSVTPGNSPVQVTVTVAQQIAALHNLPRPGLPTGGIALGFVFLLFGTGRNKSLRRKLLVIALPLLLAGSFLTGCGGSGGSGKQSGTPAGTYQITVTGTSGSLEHSTTLTLDVQ